MADINQEAVKGNKALALVLESILTDITALKTAVDASKTLTDELHDDHASFRTSVASLKTLADELKADYGALLTDVTEVRTKLVATHAKLDADAGVTDTNYAATNNPAALTATSIAAADATAAPAALTASKQTAVGTLATT